MTHHGLVRLARQQMKHLELTPYQLHQRLRGKVSKQTIYNFVTHSAIIKSDTLALIFSVLRLEIVEQGKTKTRRGSTR